MNLLKLLLKAQLRSQWSLRFLLIFSLILAVSAQVSLEAFSLRIEQSVKSDTKALLSADYQIQAYRDFTENIFSSLKKIVGEENFLRQTDMLANASDSAQNSFNISLRALEKDYPYYGKFRTEPSLTIQDLESSPKVFVEKSLRDKGFKIGDEIKIGVLNFKIAAFILEEPQTVASAFALGPRVIIHQKWFAETKILDEHSRAFRMLLVRSPLDAKTFKSEFRKDVPDPHWRVITPERANTQVSQVIERLRSFLAIVALTAVFLGSLGVFMIFRSKFQLKLQEFLWLRSLGVSSSTLQIYVLSDALITFLMGAPLGILVGIGIENLLSGFARSNLDINLSSISYSLPILVGLFVSLSTVFLGLYLPLQEILKTPLSQVLRPESSSQVKVSSRNLGVIAFFVALIIFMTARSIKLAGYFSAGMLLTSLFLILSAYLLFFLLSKIQFFLRLPYKQAAQSLLRKKSSSLLNILSIGFGVFMVFSILSIGHVLRSQVQGAHQLGVPNFYILSISPDDKEKVLSLLPSGSLLFPTTLARLKSLKGDDIVEKQSEDLDQENFFKTREYNITRRNELSEGEHLVESKTIFGEPSPGIARASLEEKFAQRLGLKKGDHFKMLLAGVEIEGRIDSLRKVNWFNFRPNFFIVFNEEDLGDAPMDFVAATNLESAQIPAKQKEFGSLFPQLTTLNGESIASKILSILDRLSFATLSVGLFSLFASLFVFVGIVLTGRPQMLEELYLWRCLGMSSRDVWKKTFFDLSLPTLAGALIGLFAAHLFSFVLSKFFLEIPFNFAPLTWSLGALLIPLLLFPSLGILILRRAVKRSPGEIFRDFMEQT